MTTIMSLAHKWLQIGRSSHSSYASLPNDLEARTWDLRHYCYHHSLQNASFVVSLPSGHSRWCCLSYESH